MDEAAEADHKQALEATLGGLFIGGLIIWALFAWLGPDDPPTADELRQEAISACKTHHRKAGVPISIVSGGTVKERPNGDYFVVVKTKLGDYRRCVMSGDRVLESN